MKTIKTLSDKRQEAARLLCNGIKAKEIARIFGIHKSTVWRWKRTPEFQAAFFVELNRPVKPSEFAKQRQAMLEEAMQSANPFAAQRAAREALRRYSTAE